MKNPTPRNFKISIPKKVAAIAAFVLISQSSIAQSACGGGFVKRSDFLPNGNFATIPTQNGTNPMPGNAPTGNGDNYNPQTLAAFNYGQGVFVQGKYYPNNGNLPSDGGFNFVTGDYTDNSGNLASGARAQRRFNGDAANGVPATPTMMIWNGNGYFGNTAPFNEVVVYQRNLTGLIVGRTYTFWYYSSNAYDSNLPDDPIMRIKTGGTVGFPDGTQVAGPLSLDEVGTGDAAPLNGWVRQSYTFTAVATSMLIKVTDGSTGNGGDDLALTAFGLDQCLPIPVSQNVVNTSMPSSNGNTAIAPLVSSEQLGSIASYNIQSIPTAAQGVLSYQAVAAGPFIPITAAMVAGAGLSLTPAQMATLSFDPTAGFIGNATFTYNAVDNNAALAGLGNTAAVGVTSNTATYTIPVTSTPPTANNITAATVSNSAGAAFIPSLTGADADGTVSSFTITTLPPAAQGVLYFNGVPVTVGQSFTPAQAALISFDPAAGFVGNASFAYTSTDNSNLTSVAANYTIPVVSGAINNTQQPPLAVNIIASQILNSNAATPIPALSGSDLDGTIASFTITSLPPAGQGTLFVNGVAVTLGQVLTQAQAAQLTFDPAPGAFVGNTSFTYTALDNSGNTSNTATYTLPITNTPPVAQPITYAAIPTNTATNTAIPALSGTDNGTITSFAITTLPTAAQGTLFLNGVAVTTLAQVAALTPAQAAQLSFRPATGFSGTVPLTYTATDNNGAVSTAAPYTIVVNAQGAATGAAPATVAITAAPMLNSNAATVIPTLTSTDANNNVSNYTVASIPPASQGVLTLNGVAVTAGQVLTIAQAAQLSFDPAPGFVGNATFTYFATDATANVSNISAYTIPVTNIAPIANNIAVPAVVGNSGNAAILPLTGSDANGTIASFNILSLLPASQGTLFLNGVAVTSLAQVTNLTPAQANQLSFTPATGFTGFAGFNYNTVDNNGALSNTANYTIPVGNIPPVTTNVTAASMPATNGATSIPSLIGTDANGTVASYTVTTLPTAAQGVLTLNGVAVTAGQILTPAQAAQLKFDPAPTFAGTATFNFTATDNLGSVSNTSIVSIPVTNPPPTANNISTPAISNTSAATPIPTLTGSDANGTVTSFTITSLPNSTTQGSLYLNGVIVTSLAQVANLTPAQAAQLSFDPVSGFVGNATFNFTSTDNQGAISTAANYTIPVVNGVPNASQTPPIANNILAAPMSNGNGNTLIPALFGSDLNGTVVSYTIATIPPASQGILTVVVNGVRVAVTAGQVLTPAQNLTLNFDPNANYVGNAVFNYTATDNQGLISNVATVTIPVINIAPIANAITATVAAGSTQAPLAILSGSDINGTIASYTITSLPTAAQGTLFLNGVAVTTLAQVANLTPAQAALLGFTPAAGFTGQAPFAYTSTDNNGAASVPATYTINVGPAVSAGAPSVVSNVTTNAIANPAGTNGAALSTLITGTDPNGNGTIASYTITSLPSAAQGVLLYQATTGGPFIAVPANTVLTPAQAATVTFDPADGFVGNANFSYIATDNTGNNSNTGTYTIPVTNQAPVSNNVLAPQQLAGTSLNPIPSLQGIDVDGTVTSYQILTIPPASEGTLFYQATTGGPMIQITGPISLTPAQAATIRFTANGTFQGFANFTYNSIDNSGNVGNTANYIIPVGAATGTLPVTLVSFTAVPKGNDVALSFTIENAINVSHFEIMASVDGIRFASIGTVQYVNGVAVYNFTDTRASNGANYYQLKTVDKDGKLSLSNILVVKFAANVSISIFPNPTSQFVNLQFSANLVGKYTTVRVMNNIGQVVMMKNEKIAYTTTQLNVSNLPSATYFVQVIVNNELVKSIKLVVQK